MPAPENAKDFFELLRRSGVLDAVQIADFQAQNPLLPSAPSYIADEMIRQGLLTRFQTKHLLAGRHRGLVIDQYRLLEQLGQGGAGVVFLAEHARLKRRVALKVLPADRAKDEEALKRFYRETQAVAVLDHPNIVKAHDSNRAGNLHYLVMEYVEGKSLHDMLQEFGPFPYPQAANFISQAAAGLQHAFEKGLIHRDIKPANLLLDRSGTIKVLDMGLARFFQENDDGLTRDLGEGAAIGTADFMAPEQALDSHDVDIRADIYSLGITFYNLLVGQPPFAKESLPQKLLAHQMKTPKPIREHRAEIPEGLADIVDRMIAKDPAARFQTPGEVHDALAPWIAGTTATWPDASFKVATAIHALQADTSGASGIFADLADQIGPGSSIVVSHRNSGVNLGRDSSKKLVEAVQQGGLKWPLLIGSGLVLLGFTFFIARSLLNGPGPEPLAKKPTDIPPPVIEEKLPPKKDDKKPEGSAPLYEQERFLGHTGSIDAMVLHPNQMLWSTGADGTIRQWDVAGATQLNEIEPLKGIKNRGLLLSPDGQRAMTVAYGKQVRLWNLDAKKEIAIFDKFPANIHAAAFFADGQRILAGAADGSLHIANWADKSVQSVLPANKSAIQWLFLSPDGKQALTGSADLTVRLIDLESGEQKWAVKKHALRLAGGSVHWGSRQAATGGGDLLARVFSLDTGTETKVLKGHAATVTALAFSADGKHLLTGSDDKSLILWDIASGKELFRYPGHQKAITAVAFLKDGRPISASQDGTLRRWDPPAVWIKSPKSQLEATDVVDRIVISHGGKWTATLQKNGIARLWEGDKLTLKHELKGHKGPINAANFSADQDQIVTAGQDATMRVYELAKGKQRKVVPYPRPVTAVLFSADEISLFAGGDGGYGRMIAIETGQVVKEFLGHTALFTAAVYSPDGKTLYTASADKTIKAFSSTTGGLKFSVDFSQRVNGLALTDSGHWLIAGVADGTVAVVDVRTGDVLRKLEGHKGPVQAVAISPGDHWALAAGTTGIIHVWDFQTGKLVRFLDAHTGPVTSLAVRPDGRHVLSSSADKAVRVWELPAR